MKLNYRHLFKVFALMSTVMFYCEYLNYYLVIWDCHWPELASDHDHEAVLKAMFISDTHLLGSRQGHWLDKLRREWQMHRAFVTATDFLEPEVVFFLGDIFDEGKWAPEEEFDSTVDRFNRLFPFDNKIIVVGNHDIGFHYAVTPYLRRRFYDAFGLDSKKSGVRRITLKRNIHFVLVDSMAMHGDNCFFCEPARRRVKEIADEFKCMHPSDSTCELTFQEDFSRPILLQHFPLYRKSDAVCHDEPDVDPNKERPFKIQWDCLSEESSIYLMEHLRPRLVVSGHTHHGCRALHKLRDGQTNVPEWSVASFSWRNRNNPVAVLATITREEFVLNKCYMPHESTVLQIYIVCAILIAIYCVVTRRKFCRRY